MTDRKGQNLKDRPKRVLVCGGRGYNDLHALWSALKALQPVAAVIEGGSPGANRLAREWARCYEIKFKTYEAMWGVHGNAAGPLRNQRMIDEGKPDVVLAAPGGKGTADLVRRARAAGIEVIEIKELVTDA
jgi:hypothetical protein